MRASHFVKSVADETQYQTYLAKLEELRLESIRAEEEAQREQKIATLLAKIPLRFRGKTFENFKIIYPGQLTVRKTAQRFVETFSKRSKEGTCLIFQGKPGTGKTFLSLLIYRALAELGFSVAYESSLHFLKAIQEKKFESHGAFNAVLNYYRQLPLLIIDEVTEGCGKDGYLAEWERSILFAVIDARYQEQRCTIVISNRTKADMVDRLSTPIMDRLIENGIIAGFDWDSYRQHQNGSFSNSKSN